MKIIYKILTIIFLIWWYFGYVVIPLTIFIGIYITLFILKEKGICHIPFI